MDLFERRGYPATTIPQIVDGAGLTTRTFFRHFSDKRDVLFLREREFPQVVAATLLTAGDDLPPRGLVVFGLRAAALELEQWRAPIERRRRIIRGEPQLRERELLQYDRLAEAVRAALQERGADPRQALLLARLAALTFELSLDQWIDAPDHALAEVVEATWHEVTTAG